MFSEVADFVLVHPVVLLAGLFLSYLLYNRYGRGISQYPGPFLGSIASGWRIWDVYHHRHEIPFLQLHERYGSVVRLSPNKLSFSSPGKVFLTIAPTASLTTLQKLYETSMDRKV